MADIATSDDVSSAPSTARDTKVHEIKEASFERGLRFWAIIAGLSITKLLAALENTVVTTAAPEILSDLQLGENFVWITNAFFIASAAFQPLFGQLSNTFGRRWVALAAVSIFTLGSGVCGGATSGAMLIAGRTVQGLGSGGVLLLVDIILADLVPLRQRGNYLAMINAVYGVGVTLGPFIGGAIASSTSWRWVFYLELPIGAVSLVLLYSFLHVNYNMEATFAMKIRRIDFIGNGILVAGTIAVLYALAYAGSRYLWSDWQTIVPIVLGLVLFILFAIFEVRGPSEDPVMPARLFKSRTSVIVAVTTFINSCLVFWVLYFLPVFFQAVLLYSPRRTGVALLPQALLAIPGSIVAGIALAKWGRFKPLHLIGFALLTLGFGLLVLQDKTTTVAEWVIYQVIGALGAGMNIDTLLPAFQAPQAESDQAAATAAWSYIRSFGWVWGVAIPAAVFNNRFNSLLATIPDQAARDSLSHGRAYQNAAAQYVERFNGPLQDAVRGIYSDALKRTFQVGVGFGGLAFILSLFVEEIPLRHDLETEFGLEKKKKESPSDC